MASDQLPDTIDPWKYCQSGRELKLTLDQALFKRASEMLVEVKGQMEFELQFDMDPQRQPFVKGHLRGEAVLTCQRCLQPMTAPLDDDFIWGLVRSEEAAENLPRLYEPVMIEDEKLDLMSVLEDELILALPVVALHPEEVCQLTLSEKARLEEAPKADDASENPFSALADLKRSLQSKQ
ncbi:hypothetical protein BFW38_04915 [Terasakiispira papahanaumokuakeensis]|uniref:Large ribosomal RNA subunit accumulation protein YceD n=1 Tax=Terasakiispira papahanaumokuakeensis TaxID=197479 RepID=A0A1E2VEV0_9GAMM|nr:YceD family protein [Terasakiispira papahanaumokuakeensis]ODC05195.1 hypothetical protein BFW38_04915 [Terasakiispira papahanaumokuakeensis]